jgi:tyrosyl-tRNA synthetase
VFTLLDKEEIERLEAEHAEAPHLRIMQKALAMDVTIRVHSEKDYALAVKASEVLFGKATLETLKSIDAEDFEVIFEGVPQSTIARSDWTETANVLDLVSVTTSSEIYPSKGEARRAIQQNAVSINKTKVTGPEQSLADFELLQNQFLLVSKGKKNHLIKVED